MGKVDAEFGGKSNVTTKVECPSERPISISLIAQVRDPNGLPCIAMCVLKAEGLDWTTMRSGIQVKADQLPIEVIEMQMRDQRGSSMLQRMSTLQLSHRRPWWRRWIGLGWLT